MQGEQILLSCRRCMRIQSIWVHSNISIAKTLLKLLENFEPIPKISNASILPRLFLCGLRKIILQIFAVYGVFESSHFIQKIAFISSFTRKTDRQWEAESTTSIFFINCRVHVLPVSASLIKVGEKRCRHEFTYRHFTSSPHHFTSALFKWRLVFSSFV